MTSGQEPPPQSLPPWPLHGIGKQCFTRNVSNWGTTSPGYLARPHGRVPATLAYQGVACAALDPPLPAGGSSTEAGTRTGFTRNCAS